jgi:exopolysaccharide production protein ExoQ
LNTSATTFEAGSTTAQPTLFLPALIGFFFSFRIFSVVLTVRVLQQDPQVGVAINLGVNFLLLLLVVFQTFGPAPRTLGSLLRLPCLFWVLLFLGFSGCSLIWSVADSLPAAAAFWGGMAADWAMVILLLRSGSISEVSASLIKGIVYGACCVALVAWIMPAQSDLRLGDEDLLGPNAIGYACGFAMFFAEYLILVRREKGPWKFSLVFLGITLLRSLSKTTIIAFIASGITLLLLDKSISRKTKVIVVLSLIVIFILFSSLLVSYFSDYTDTDTDTGDQTESLSGRLGIWAYILNEAVDKPLIGHGFHSVWHVIPPFYRSQFEARHAHNELLQQFYAYGAVGVVMLIGLYGSFYRQIKKLPASPLKAMLFGLLVFILIRGLADTEAFDLSLPLWAITLFSALMSEAMLSPSQLDSPDATLPISNVPVQTLSPG